MQSTVDRYGVNAVLKKFGLKLLWRRHDFSAAFGRGSYARELGRTQ